MADGAIDKTHSTLIPPQVLRVRARISSRFAASYSCRARPLQGARREHTGSIRPTSNATRRDAEPIECNVQVCQARDTKSWKTKSSSRPSLSRSPLRRGDSDTRQSLTNVPFVLPRSSTVSSVWVACRRQCTLESRAVSTMKSARGPRPTVRGVPGVIRRIRSVSSLAD